MFTGDLTDAKDQTKIDSSQYIEEWEVYSGVLKETKVEERTNWLDIRGNHGTNIFFSTVNCVATPWYGGTYLLYLQLRSLVPRGAYSAIHH